MGPSDRLKELSKCVRCGSCSAVCPTYGEEASESMGARGRLTLLRALASGNLQPSVLLNERIFSCLACGACEGTCPLGVDIPEVIYRGRSLLSHSDKRRRHLRAAARFSSRRPELAFRIAKTAQRILFPPLFRRGLIPPLPALPEAPLRKTDQVFKPLKKRGRVAVFAGCSVNFLFPQLGESLINVLRRFGYEVVLPKGEVCCGAPLRSLGLEEEAVALAKKNLRIFGRLKVEAVLSLCPTCTLALKREYPRLTGHAVEKAMDISSFFKDKLEPSPGIGKSAVFHDPCHLRHGLGIRGEPRELIGKAGLDVVEPAEQGCCGFGGVFCLSFGDLSRRLLAGRAKELLDSKADTVVTSCPGCILQLSRSITDRPVLHLIEIIEDTYCFPEEK